MRATVFLVTDSTLLNVSRAKIRITSTILFACNLALLKPTRWARVVLAGAA